MPTNVRDPRTIVTPDAFEISDHLLGLPLARPRQRLYAMLIDLMVISFLTVVSDGIGLFIWGAVGLFLLRITFEQRPAKGQTGMKLLRLFSGCLGFMILSTVGIVSLFINLSRDDEVTVDSTANNATATILGDLGGGMGTLLRGLEVATEMQDADDDAEVEEAALELLEATEGLSMTRQARMELLQAIVPEDVEWEGRASEIFDRALDIFEGSEPSEADELDEEEVLVASMSDADVVSAFAASLGNEEEPAESDARMRAALERRMIALIATDTLHALGAQVDGLQGDLVDETTRRMAAEEALEQSGSPIAELFRDIWEQLGSAIGLWSIYFTILLTMLKGQTIGKRVLGLRVVRLDGEPITWWVAFERGGGYIAGLATGLLGFAQVLWDPNRQCIHDKIVGTVVIDDRAERTPGAWQEAALHPRGVPLQ